MYTRYGCLKTLCVTRLAKWGESWWSDVTTLSHGELLAALTMHPALHPQ